jgi:hypothetical protein
LPLTRRRSPDARQETWLIHYGDVRVGTILITFGYWTSIVEFDFGPP